MGVLGAWIAFMATDNVLPTEYAERDARIIPDPVEDGGRVSVKLTVRRNRRCPGVVHRVLRDAETNRIVAIYDPVPASQGGDFGDTETAKTFELPEELPPLVKYQAKVCFSCNLLQELRPICTDAPDIVFHVVPRGTLSK